jgi:hypothetical protein
MICCLAFYSEFLFHFFFSQISSAIYETGRESGLTSKVISSGGTQ